MLHILALLAYSLPDSSLTAKGLADVAVGLSVANPRFHVVIVPPITEPTETRNIHVRCLALISMIHSSLAAVVMTFQVDLPSTYLRTTLQRYPWVDGTSNSRESCMQGVSTSSKERKINIQLSHLTKTTVVSVTKQCLVGFTC